MFGWVREFFSFNFDDRPMSEIFYGLHAPWIRFFHDYYFRAQHLGSYNEVLSRAKREHVIIISNHALTFEALLIAYTFFNNKVGKVGVLIYPEAFKLPIFREFFRSVQCAPVSVNSGTATLHKRHILLFPEGMDFLSGLANPEGMPHFHKGFLRMAQKYMGENGKKTLYVVPVGHAGIEDSFKYWIVKNRAFMNLLVRPFVKYPFWVIPKIPMIIPSKVVFNWGRPIRLTPSELNSETKIETQTERFRHRILDLRKDAQEVRGGFDVRLNLPFSRARGL